MIIANGAELPIEIQSWDHSLSQAANLHLMLANERTRYFEASMPKEAFEFGMTNGNLLDRGRVVAPDGPGQSTFEPAGGMHDDVCVYRVDSWEKQNLLYHLYFNGGDKKV